MIQGIVKTFDGDIVREVKNCPKKYDSTPRKLIIDADSIIYTSTYFPEDSIMTFSTEEEQIEEAKFRVGNKLQEIQNNIEEHYNITNTVIFVGGKNNFRYKLFPEYKANRVNKEKSPYLGLIKDYLEEIHDAIPSHNAEADDYVIEYMKECKRKCIIACIDKDIMYYAPDIPIYDYRSYGETLGEFKLLTNLESRLAIASQIVTGDATDGIPGAPGVGKAWCIKNLHQNMTDYQFIKNIYLAYLKAHKGDNKEAKTKMKLYYHVLKLHTQKEIKSLLKQYGY